MVPLLNEGGSSISDLSDRVNEKLPSNFDQKLTDAGYNEWTALSNYLIPILQTLGLESARYDDRIESGDRPDFLWSDKDGIQRIVGEFKSPWVEDESPTDIDYQLNLAIDEAEEYNSELRLRYLLASDCRTIWLHDAFSESDGTITVDLLEVWENPQDETVEQDLRRLSRRIETIYGGEWNPEPSERDIQDRAIFSEFIEEARKALKDDLLPSIKGSFRRYEERYQEYLGLKEELEQDRSKVVQDIQDRRDSPLFQEAVQAINDDIHFDLESHYSDAPGDVTEEAHLRDLAELREKLQSISTRRRGLQQEYEQARAWNRHWTSWLDLTGKEHSGASKQIQQRNRQTFQLQTLQVLFNRILIIRTLEDMGMVGRVLSDGFLKGFDAEVTISRSNKYRGILTTASQQASEIYGSIFESDTPHDWYEFDQTVLKTILRRFDNFNFQNVDRDIFGEMYQQCLTRTERKRLGSFYTPPEVVAFLLDYTGFRVGDHNLKTRTEKILDPACGSGTFLLEFMRRSFEDYSTSGYDFSGISDTREVLENLNEKIFGFDVDPFAVQLAQTNLLVSVLQKVSRAYGDESEVGHLELDIPPFSVFETDSLLKRLHETEDRQIAYEAMEKDPEHLEDVVRAKEDVDYKLVIGNPPYIRSHNQDSEITDKYHELHETFSGDQPDIFLPFVEQGIEWLEEGGQLAFIISNSVLINDDSEDLMRFLLENATLDLVVDMTRCKVFGKEVNVFPILLVVSKKPGTENEQIRTDNNITVVRNFVKGSPEGREWAHALDLAAADLIEDRSPPDFDFARDFESDEYPEVADEDVYEIYQIRQSRFTENWSDWTDRLVLNIQTTDELWDVVREIESSDSCAPLYRFCENIERGGEGSPTRGEEPSRYRPHSTEAEEGVPVLSGSGIGRFYIDQSATDEWIDLDEARDDESDVSNRKLEVFEDRIKIAYAESAPRLSFVVDDPDSGFHFYNKQAYFLLLRAEGEGYIQTRDSVALDAHYICALLNSSLLDFYFKAYYEQKSFRHAPAIRCRTSYIWHLPIYIPEIEERDEVVGISQSIHERKKEYGAACSKRESLLDEYLESGDCESLRAKTSAVLDAHETYSLQSLNLDVEGSSLQLNRYFTVEAYSPEEAREIARFLEAYWDTYYGSGRPEDIYLPDDLQAFREEEVQLRERIATLEAEIESLEEDLDEVVYRLYGMSSYRPEIDSYLESFETVIK